MGRRGDSAVGIGAAACKPSLKCDKVWYPSLFHFVWWIPSTEIYRIACSRVAVLTTNFYWRNFLVTFFSTFFCWTVFSGECLPVFFCADFNSFVVVSFILSPWVLTWVWVFRLCWVPVQEPCGFVFFLEHQIVRLRARMMFVQHQVVHVRARTMFV